jgi:hypothetical protein
MGERDLRAFSAGGGSASVLGEDRMTRQTRVRVAAESWMKRKLQGGVTAEPDGRGGVIRGPTLGFGARFPGHTRSGSRRPRRRVIRQRSRGNGDKLKRSITT